MVQDYQTLQLLYELLEGLAVIIMNLGLVIIIYRVRREDQAHTKKKIFCAKRNRM